MDLDVRMKLYEQVPKNYLSRRTPVIIRIDGKTFHTVAKKCKKPFDERLSYVMQRTTAMLAKSIQNCVFAYSQSDEISLLLIDYYNLDTAPWFDNNLQKITSISASIATAWFNEYASPEQGLKLPAMFDARAFNIPIDEVNNYFLWRQFDAEINSIQALAQDNYSAKQMHGISCKNLVVKLEEEKNIIWGCLPTLQKRGFAYKSSKLDLDIPRFNINKRYIESLLEIPEKI